jgi:hypothetical protein
MWCGQIVEAWASQGKITKEEALEISWEAIGNKIKPREGKEHEAPEWYSQDERPLFADNILKLHKNLTNPESSLLVEIRIRTGAVGLKGVCSELGTRG